MACALLVGMAAGELSGAGKALNPPIDVKVLHFPAERSVGDLLVEDESDGWDFFGPAQGNVVVPVDRNIKLTIHLVGPRPDDLSGLAELGPSDLHELSIQSSIRRTPASRPRLKSLSHLTGLRVLSLGNTGVTGQQMESLKSLSSLQSLTFVREHSFGSAGLAALKNFAALEYLDCYTRPIDAGLKHLAQLPNLKRLRLRMGGIRGPGLAYLAAMPRLERLTLWGTTGLTDQHIRYLEGLRRLKSLKLWGNDTALTDASLASISKLAALEELHLVRLKTDFTDAGVAKLTNIPKLRVLGASPDDASILAGMEQLESVDGIALNSRNMKALAGLSNLKSLGLKLDAPVNVSAGNPGSMLSALKSFVADPVGNPVARLDALKSLEKLHIGGWSGRAKCFGDEELALLESLSGLKDLSIPVDGLTDRGLASIGKLKQLESLHLMGMGKNNRLSNRGLNHLNGLSNLRKLSMNMQSKVWLGDDDTPLDLSGLTNLKNITLISIRLKGSDWAFLANQNDLKDLWLNNCGVCPEDGLRYIKDLPKLKHLDLQTVDCTEGDGLAILDGLKKLGSIRMIGHVTDRALGRLPSLPSVRLFDVETDVAIRPATIAHLKQVLPNVRNVNVKQPGAQSRSPMPIQGVSTTRQGRSQNSRRRTRR
ncbi:MAG: hypothetical protein ISS79_01460 [Phycisphaerae bacterium]|nr:hypothetical protein [Phycisphaerae bacterium]